MASKKPAAKAEAVTPVSIVIEDSAREERDITLGDQHMKFRAPTPNVLALKAQAFVKDVDAITIDSDAMLLVADEELRKIKGAIAALDEMRESVSKPLYQAWEANNAIYRQPKATLEAGAKALAGKIAGYHLEVQRRADEERRRAEAEAEAERQRLAAEAEAANERAAQAAMEGDEQQAEELFQQAEASEVASQVVTARQVDIAPAKIAGSSVAYRWGAELPESNQDKLAALKYIIANPQFLNLVAFDQKAANQLASALRDNFQVPGFKAKKTPAVAQRGVRAGGFDAL